MIHPDTSPSTDTIVSPTSEAGFEVYYLLQDSAAPEEFVSSVQMPEYAHLEQVNPTTAQVVNDSGEVLMTIGAPWARDATGKSVAISLRVDGDDVITQVDHRDDETATYPILADPNFYTRGDNVHISSTAPRAVSAHGWWVVDEDACECLNDATADINVKIQWYHNGSWTTVESKTTEKVKPGGGSSRRAAAREVCSASGTANKWRSVIDVDVRGWIDSADKKITPTQTIYCTP